MDTYPTLRMKGCARVCSSARRARHPIPEVPSRPRPTAAGGRSSRPADSVARSLPPPQRPPVCPLTACTTHHSNCRLSDGQPFHCLIVGYNTTRVVAVSWRALRGMWRGACGASSVRCGPRVRRTPPTPARRLPALWTLPLPVDPAASAELPGTLLRQGRQGRTPLLLARICHGSEMFVSTT